MRIFLAFTAASILLACGPKPKPAGKLTEAVAVHFEAALKPFYHGVASGDPLADRVIIWTRVTPEDALARIPVRWEISKSESFEPLLQSDTTSALASKDYTVKLDVGALEPGTIYFYRFRAMDTYSITGRTKTATVGRVDSLKFAVASCSNWEWGYFTPYGNIAKRPVLDAVIHLGDYIYEYGVKTYGDTSRGRVNIPQHEIITLSDYRTRYSLYRLDKGLREVHQQHPFITIWDDHEIANNSYTEGAQNHQPNEGDYQARRNAARQAYYEWLPIRESENLYRHFPFGDLADLIMLDERLAGRTKPVDSLTDVTYASADRHMLGAEQMDWFTEKLANSKSVWKLIGNQVIYSDVDFTGAYSYMTRNLDAWDGYPAEKHQIRDFVFKNSIQNMVFVTGDTHASWAIEALAANGSGPKRAVGVEFGATSISSANDDEYKPASEVLVTEATLQKKNPHIKYVNGRDHGYLLVTLYPTQTKAEWFYVETLLTPQSKEFLGKQVLVKSGETAIR